MVKIGIDARLYSQTGVGVYLRNLLQNLRKSAWNDMLFYVYLLPADYFIADVEGKNFVKRVTESSWHTLDEQIRYAYELYRDDLDLMHFTYFSYPIFYRRKFIATIHDTTPLLFKTGKASTKNALLYELKYQAFKLVVAQQISNSEFVITPTKSVKKELVNIYGARYESKIKPIYEGVNFELQKADDNPAIALEKPFFIYIGNFYPHKNIEKLIEAYSYVRTDVKLILVGPDDYFSSRILRQIKMMKQEKRIIFYHNPSKADLIFLYKNALALIHPSLSEGFGLPLIEAVYYKLPIIASDINVFRELLGNKYYKFNPGEVRDIAAKIQFYLRKKQKTDYGKIIDNYSFSVMTKKTLDLYSQALV